MAGKHKIKIKAIVPQAEFLDMPHKFRAFVAGYGCLRESTEIVTSNGLVPIGNIDRPMQILSLNEKNNQLEFCQGGSAFPKGKANLYRIVTTQGEFAANESHRILGAEHKYLSVCDLSVGQEVCSSFGDPFLTNLVQGQIEYQQDDLCSTNKASSYQGHCVRLGHFYDQLLQLAEDTFQFSFPSLAYAQGSCPHSGLSDILQKGDCLEQLQKHTQRCLFFGRKHNCHLRFLLGRLDNAVANLVSSLFPEHTFDGNKDRQRFLLKSSLHHKEHGFAESKSHYNHGSNALKYLFSRFYSLINSPVNYYGQEVSKPTKILAIEKQKVNEYYWDMQVEKNHNYLTPDGIVHHNSSKTVTGCMAMCQHFYEWPLINQGYFAPTFPHIRDIFYPSIEEVADWFNMSVEIKEGNKEVHFYSGNQYRGTTICRSLERPGSIIGFKIGHAMVDELDVLPIHKAKQAWQKIIARMRYKVDGLKNGIDVTTTPEGFKYVYQLFFKNPAEKHELAKNYGLIQASTYDNEKNLPDDYIPSLIEAYPSELIDAYIDGQFVNLTSGTVYRNYDRIKHNSLETIQEKEPLYIGMDFNVQHMAATIYVQRRGAWHAVAELKEVFDTPDMIKLIQNNWQSENHPITIYPDASGKSRKSVNASESDIFLLRQAKFKVKNYAANPLVKSRVLVMNKAFESDKLFINHIACPTVAECLEQQNYDKNGEPDKKSGFDHQNDASSYPIAYEMPIKAKAAVLNTSW